MIGTSRDTFHRDALVLAALYIVSALAVRATFGTNEIFRFPWLVSGPTVYLVLVHGYRVLGVAFVATVLGNLVFGTAPEAALWNSARGVVALGFGGWIYRRASGRSLSFVELSDLFRLFGAALGMALLATVIATLQFKIQLPVVEVKSHLHRIAGYSFGFLISNERQPGSAGELD